MPLATRHQLVPPICLAQTKPPIVELGNEGLSIYGNAGRSQVEDTRTGVEVNGASEMALWCRHCRCRPPRCLAPLVTIGPTHLPGPAEVSIAVELGDEDVVAESGRRSEWPAERPSGVKVNGAVEKTRSVDIAAAVHRYAIAPESS